MQNKAYLLLVAITFFLSGCFSLHNEGNTLTSPESISPYVDMTDREIKAMSEDRIHALLNGAGAGYALTAELNSYPGPLHALELAAELSLTNEQEQTLKELFQEMKDEAKKVGAKIIDLETQFEEEFRNRRITLQDVEMMSQKIALLDGELRSIHLNAHLATAEIFSAEQIELYDQLRGYSMNNGSPHPSHQNHGKHH
ncbi:Spy/CpxP family protein refolding chaperone [Caldalkalibacillus mannanilyticus]|uniref:Spy/CpxP family protein refolding chaperone n=1 Tax=Caldalkalibacillus mannanilyticus TaxID=1418 RepID=UPI0004691C63|nr:Spy/CpxP family protein refolding chaperone [Caldalkalibacillus mannanilyticus]